MSYSTKVKAIAKPTFNAIRNIAWDEISSLTKETRDNNYEQLKRGVALLETNEQLCQYLFSFGKMHQAKLLDAFSNLPIKLFNEPFEIIDWGCGQGMGVINLFDFLESKKMNLNIQKITLIEPSSIALERAVLHTSIFVDSKTSIIPINDFFENILPDQIKSEKSFPVVHIFSNILDVAEIDLKKLANLVDNALVSDNYIVCVGPLNPTNRRIDAFYNYFNIEESYSHEDANFKDAGWTYKCKIYQLKKAKDGNLVPIEYYPTVQFHAAYELDLLRHKRKELKSFLSEIFTHFEVAAPFDLGASIYDDVHPILAILNNIITRGLPTKASVFIEEEMSKAFQITQHEVVGGEIKFTGLSDIEFKNHETLFDSCLDKNTEISAGEAQLLQLFLTPIAVARFQKVLIEAIITGHLGIEKDSWKILVEEEDVPFAALAIKDFSKMFYHLTQLTDEYRDYLFPEIELHIISNKQFFQSKLHLGASVYLNAPNSLNDHEFDLVVSLAMLKSVNSSIESFSKFKSLNNCYFNIRTIAKKRSERVLYTSKLVKYRHLGVRTTQGNYIEQLVVREHLIYFLQLIFRKDVFRPGQLPILDRALQNLPVIGLLPTGGGKSLTYQMAALLQPGVTMVVDPLKSLMKDQYDGLVNNGIDCCAYINSSLSWNEQKRREKQLESSQLLFVFLSPERLAISSFRERLKNMHDFNVYFSYGVIDEVHCVSEWGHDFRFSYLHLGRNLYSYVKSKSGVISLFGLTATASFDVLADVERELSGNGAFILDNDAIVRYENTNRLELQYKIEKVPAKFEVDSYYDMKNQMPPGLPKAVNINNHWPIFDSKSDFLNEYIKSIPKYINELQEPQNVELINKSFIERQNNLEGSDVNLKIDMPEDFYVPKGKFDQAGIVFCPHVDTTGLSVRVNTIKLKDQLTPSIGSFTGSDNDESSMKNLESFRDDLLPLMIATKAFGMGIDKPNVRFTINMNYSSSLESFVQEAGRAGRDRKLALSTILISDYKLKKISSSYMDAMFPIPIIRNKWFLEEDLNKILLHFNLQIPDDYLLNADPSTDVVKLHCSKDNKMFAFNECSTACSLFDGCNLKKANSETRGWQSERELIQILRAQGINLSKKNFQYLNADYHAVMYFFNESFKGDIIEKAYMNNLLHNIEVRIIKESNIEVVVKDLGFLSSLLHAKNSESLTVYVPYAEKDYVDLSKAIYRMCCIELIEDFTQDYSKKEFRIKVVRKNLGEYFRGLKRFLLRYFTEERADREIEKARQKEAKIAEGNTLANEIDRCLSYLTEFVYDKISEKRKRAIDDMRNFCLEGVDEKKSWVSRNEALKDFIFYYFNSKYAKSDYVAENGEPFSLVEDTEGGKRSDTSILFKYLRVVDDEIVGIGTPLDNVKHLYGAVRLISRSLTDTNPALYLLESFCLAYLGLKNNENIQNQLILRYSEGMIEIRNRTDDPYEFWNLFDKFNKLIEPHLSGDQIDTLKNETILLVYGNNLSKIASKYLENYE